MDTRKELTAWRELGSLLPGGASSPGRGPGRDDLPPDGPATHPRDSSPASRTGSAENRLFVTSQGSGPPCLFLHGFPTSSFDYSRIAPLLAPHFHLIFFDFLGFGFSDKPRPHAYSLFEQAELAEEICLSRGLKEISVVAHDMGSSVALILLQRKRMQVRRLVLLNGSLLLRYYRPLLSQRLLLHPILGPWMTGLGLVNRTVFSHQFSAVFASPPPEDEIAAFWSLIAHNNGLGIYHLLIRYLNERKKHELTWMDALVSHPAPLMLLWGQKDPVSVPLIAEAVKAQRPDAHYLRLEAQGHYPQWEAPEVVAEHLIDFLRE